MERRNRTVRIADIVLAISSEHAPHTIDLDEAYRGFLDEGQPEVSIDAYFGGLPDLTLRDEDRVFDSQSLWSLYRTGGRHVFVLRWPAGGGCPYRIAVFDEPLRSGEIHSRLPSPRATPAGLLPNPLEYPLSEILMISLLARGRGLMVHACGIDDGGRGYLFAGNSTHGKTTMARLWANTACVLNDDRIILRRREGRLWMYGTPWHGDLRTASSRGVPLERILILRHAGTHDLEPLGGVAAVSHFLARCFPPFWDREGMTFSLEFASELMASVPCHVLGFRPNPDVVDFVRGL